MRKSKDILILIIHLIIIFMSIQIYAEEKLNNKLIKVVNSEKINIDEIVKLIEEGADVNTKYGNKLKTPLMFAAWFSSNPEVINFLLDNGTSAKIKDSLNKTAFNYVKDNADIEIGSPIYDRLAELRY